MSDKDIKPMQIRMSGKYDWAWIRQLYEASGFSAYTIAKMAGMPSKGAIQARAAREAWARNKVPVIFGANLVDPNGLREDIPVSPGLPSAPFRQGEMDGHTATQVLELYEKGVPDKTIAGIIGRPIPWLKAWRDSDPAFNLACIAKRSVFLQRQVETLDAAGRRGDWKAAHAILQAAPETKADYAPQVQGNNQVQVVVQFRRDEDVIDVGSQTPETPR